MSSYNTYIILSPIVSPVIAYTNPYLDVVEGSDVDLSCVVVQGNPIPTVHWQKGSKVGNSQLTWSLGG